MFPKYWLTLLYTSLIIPLSTTNEVYMNTKKNKQFPIGFTAIDNRLFYCQSVVSPNAFSILIRIHRMTEGYDGEPKSLSNTYFQKTCNISKNTVTRVIKELEQNNLIIVKRRARANSLYLVNIDTIFNIYESQVNTPCISKEVTDESPDVCSIKQNPLKQNIIKENINIPFSDFWDKYDYCKGKKSDVEAKWIALSDEDRTLTMKSLDTYLLSTPDKTYRKYPMSYLNTEAWNDEHIVPVTPMAKPMATTSTSQTYSNNNSNNVYSASFKPFEDNSSKHTKDELESNLEALGISSGNTLDTKEAHNNSDNTPTDIVVEEALAISSQMHWSELKARGLFKHKQNPTAIAPNTSKSKEIDDFLSRFGSKSKHSNKNIISGNSVIDNGVIDNKSCIS